MRKLLFIAFSLCLVTNVAWGAGGNDCASAVDISATINAWAAGSGSTWVDTGDTTGAGDTCDPNCAPYYGDGEDHFWVFTLTQPLSLRIHTCASGDFDDTSLWVDSDCCFAVDGDPVELCSDDACGGYGYASDLGCELYPPGTYYVSVDGYAGGTSYTLTIEECGGAYCASNATSTADSLISQVEFNTILNTSGTTPCVAYSDFTALSTDIEQASAYTVYVTGNSCSTGNYSKWCKVFIDWNGDYDFADPGEQVFSASVAGAAGTVVSGSVAVPITASLGPTRMRVVLREGGSEATTLACGTYTWGETEDYTVNIVPATGTTYTLTMLDPGGTGGGTVSPPVGANVYAENTVVDLVATPDVISFFDRWEVDGVLYSNDASTTLLMDVDYTVQAFFDACEVTCPSGGVAEGEPLCAAEYEDVYNGGCNSTPNVFQDINDGDVICGESGTFLFTGLNYRDTDWYRLELTEAKIINWTVEAEFPSLAFIIAANSEDCSDDTVVTSATAAFCEVNAISSGNAVPAGVYWLLVMPSIFDGIPCGSGYVATVTLSDPPPPPVNDECVDAIPMTVGVSEIEDITFATDDAQSTAVCTTGALNQAIWYSVVGNGNTYTVTTCNAGGSFNDTKLQVWCRDCADLTCVVGNDDATCAISGLRSTASWCTAPGITYLIAVGGFSTNVGIIETLVTDDGVPCTGAVDCSPLNPDDPTDCAAVDPILCAGESTDISATSADTIYWFEGVCDDVIGNEIGTGSPLTVTPSVTTDYYARAYDGANWSLDCCMVTVTVNPNPDCTLSAPAAYIESSPGTASVPDAGTGATYAWTVTGNVTNVTGDTTRTVSFDVGVAGTDVVLSCAVTDANTCTCSVGPVSVPVTAAPPIPATGPAGIGLLLLAIGGLMTLARRRK